MNDTVKELAIGAIGTIVSATLVAFMSWLNASMKRFISMDRALQELTSSLKELQALLIATKEQVAEHTRWLHQHDEIIHELKHERREPYRK